MESIALAEAKCAPEPGPRSGGGGRRVGDPRRGKPVARVVPVQPPVVPLPSLAAFWAQFPKMRRSSTEMLRAIRDEG
ncbi:MAG: type II toxin-antitoxin system Phd/YefM family antitoxin [Acidithiobacillus ferrivorans]